MFRVSIELVSLKEKAPWIAIHFGLNNQTLQKTSRNESASPEPSKSRAHCQLRVDDKLVQWTLSDMELRMFCEEP
jgi:hypothetical protein